MDRHYGLKWVSFRSAATTSAKIVETNRATPPDFIIIKDDELSGGKPFGHIDDLISQAELRQIAANYAQIAGFSLDSIKAA